MADPTVPKTTERLAQRLSDVQQRALFWLGDGVRTPDTFRRSVTLDVLDQHELAQQIEYVVTFPQPWRGQRWRVTDLGRKVRAIVERTNAE